MKKIISMMILYFAMSISLAAGEETHLLKLRASYHPGFLRIVIEGHETIMSNAIVNQKDNNILVRFPDTHFTVRKETTTISYNTEKDTVIFSPGNFSKFKAFPLRHPSRLVIDVYLDTGIKMDKSKERALPYAEKPAEEQFYPKPMRRDQSAVIIIDPGHGGYDPGIASEDLREKNVVLDISRKLLALINKGQNKCLLTRESDQFISLKERAKFANARDADIFLSLHIGNHSGIVIYTPVITDAVPAHIKTYMLNKGQEDYMVKTALLRYALQKAVKDAFGDGMVTVKPLPYSILSKIGAAALIIELPSFEDAIYVEELKTEIADTIYKGLYLYEESASY